MDRFTKAQQFVAKWEGDLSNDKYDAGGITKYGVCLRFLQEIQPDATADTVKNLTKEQASEIFKQNFWVKAKCEELLEPIGFILYDTVVNTGIAQGVKFLQRALGIEADGKIGKNTIAKANDCNVKSVVESFLTQREEFYNKIVAKKPTQKCFLKGWLNRVADLRKEVNKLL